MIQYTTPTLTFELDDATIGEGDRVWVSIEQKDNCGSAEVDIDVPPSGVTVAGSLVTVKVTLTQEQSGRFRPGRAKAQVNWISSDGTRLATKAGWIEVDENILDRVVSYE